MVIGEYSSSIFILLLPQNPQKNTFLFGDIGYQFVTREFPVKLSLNLKFSLILVRISEFSENLILLSISMLERISEFGKISNLERISGFSEDFIKYFPQ